MRRESRIAGLALASLGVASVLVLMAWGDGTSADALTSRTPAPSSVALAVLGDSNSHSYQDYVWFPAASNERGGTRRARTFQWTEVLARMRGQELDLGPWKKWGRPGVVARAREFLGMDGGRAPKKEDYLFNFANSGASCKNLMGGRFRQAPRLVELMDRSPERWKNGVVVIRIGLNNWQGLLDVQAQDPNSAQSQAAIDYCSEQIGDAIALIRKSHPTTHILLVGIGNEADDPGNFERWQSVSESANIRSALDRFNGEIRRLAETSPGVAFFDDSAWFRQLWGARDAQGKPDYRTVDVGAGIRVTNTVGDDPHNALLEDRHAGLVWNALWAQALVERLREAFQLPLTPIANDELAQFLQPLVKP